MSDESALLAAIRAFPQEDTPRLAYADWLDENTSRHDRAEFIRKQIRLLRMPGGVEFDEERDAVRGWLMRCIDNGDPALWLAIDLGLPPFDWSWSGDEIDTRINTAWRDYGIARGFLESVSLTASDWLTHGDDIERAAPLERITLTTRPTTLRSDVDGVGAYTLLGDPQARWFTGAAVEEERGREFNPNNARPHEWFRALLRLRWPRKDFTISAPMTHVERALQTGTHNHAPASLAA